MDGSVGSLQFLARLAVAYYTPLELHMRLCRHDLTLDPGATAAYAHAYREMWDGDGDGEERG